MPLALSGSLAAAQICYPADLSLALNNIERFAKAFKISCAMMIAFSLNVFINSVISFLPASYLSFTCFLSSSLRISKFHNELF